MVFYGSGLELLSRIFRYCWYSSSYSSILGPTLFLHYVNDLPYDVACDWTSDVQQQLELASELESGLRDAVDCDRQ